MFREARASKQSLTTVQRFVTVEPVGQDRQDQATAIHIVENWYEDFRDRKQN